MRYACDITSMRYMQAHCMHCTSMVMHGAMAHAARPRWLTITCAVKYGMGSAASDWRGQSAIGHS